LRCTAARRWWVQARLHTDREPLTNTDRVGGGVELRTGRQQAGADEYRAGHQALLTAVNRYSRTCTTGRTPAVVVTSKSTDGSRTFSRPSGPIVKSATVRRAPS